MSHKSRCKSISLDLWSPTPASDSNEEKLINDSREAESLKVSRHKFRMLSSGRDYVFSDFQLLSLRNTLFKKLCSDKWLVKSQAQYQALFRQILTEIYNAGREIGPTILSSILLGYQEFQFVESSNPNLHGLIMSFPGQLQREVGVPV